MTDLAHCLVKQARVHYGIHSGRIHIYTENAGTPQLHRNVQVSRKETMKPSKQKESYSCKNCQKLVNEIKQDKEWLSSISKELNCNETNEVEKKIKDKMRKIMDSNMHNKKLKIDKEGKHIIFSLFIDAHHA